VEGIVSSTDPALLSTPAILASERTSSRVFIAPAVLLLVLILAVAALFVRRRHRRIAGASGAS
jgi:hypothetical protein